MKGTRSDESLIEIAAATRGGMDKRGPTDGKKSHTDNFPAGVTSDDMPADTDTLADTTLDNTPAAASCNTPVDSVAELRLPITCPMIRLPMSQWP